MRKNTAFRGDYLWELWASEFIDELIFENWKGGHSYPPEKAVPNYYFSQEYTRSFYIKYKKKDSKYFNRLK